MSRAGQDGDINIGSKEHNNYQQGRSGSGTPKNPGPARSKGDLGKNPTKGGGINRATHSASNQSVGSS